MEFLVNLIVIADEQTNKAKQALNDNCTHVTGNVYLMEGDLESLLDDELVFNFLGESVVGSLGGLKERELIRIVYQSFGKNAEKLKFNPNETYH